jgi:hypothetical protein
MLIAKLTQPVSKIYQMDGLNTTTVTAQYLAAQVVNYAMGQLKTNFYYKIGKVKFDETSKIIEFDPVIRGTVQVEISDLENWGTDDFVALEAIAKALGVELEEEHFIFEDGIPKA